MSDTTLRKLERRWHETTAARDQRAYLQALARAGRLDLDAVLEAREAFLQRLEAVAELKVEEALSFTKAKAADFKVKKAGPV